MRTLSIDIETHCELDLKDVGVYKYAEHPSFEVLMIAYAYDDGPVQIWDAYSKEPEPRDLYYGLMEDTMIKTAYNANFERTCLAKHFRAAMPPQEWRCTAVHAATLGLPRSLGEVAQIVGLDEDKQKMKAGKSLIQFFSKPCKPTKRNGNRTRNLPHHDPERWALFLDYCKQDVEVERELRKRLERFPVLPQEQALWELDQIINDTGVLLDRTLVDSAVQVDKQYRDMLEKEAQIITGLDNINSLSQVKSWLDERVSLDMQDTGLTKASLGAIMDATDCPDAIRVLEIRAELGKTSTSKYHKMAEVQCNDDRARGLLQFYGANRTGRWAGRLVQVQNLPQNKLKDLRLARTLLRAADSEGLELLYGNVPDTMSQLIRTAFIPEPGNLFYVADFSAIEARVIAWLADQHWRMDVFRTHGKIYEASASKMFGVPLETITKDGPNYQLRQKGKIAELALGYGGSVGALTAMGALNMGLEQSELKPLVDAWRSANTDITALWWGVGEAAINAVQDKGVTYEHRGIHFKAESGFLFITLPSGRRLAYVRPRLEDDRWGRPALTYEGVDKTWGRIDTYGPKLVENIIQAISRDLLGFSMLNLAEAGFKIVMHVHDEVIIEAPETAPEATLDKIIQTMSMAPGWAKGLPLTADGYTCDFYKKD
jgi:DNA polymerase